MIASFDPGALLGASYRLADGTRVRLRMVAPSDRQRIRALVQACASCDDELVTERLVRFDPRTRAVVCATALIGGCETMVGVGAIDLTADGPRAPIPNPLLVAEFAPAGVADLLAGALLGRAGALARTRAA